MTRQVFDGGGGKTNLPESAKQDQTDSLNTSCLRPEFCPTKIAKTVEQASKNGTGKKNVCPTKFAQTVERPTKTR